MAAIEPDLWIIASLEYRFLSIWWCHSYYEAPARFLGASCAVFLFVEARRVQFRHVVVIRRVEE